MTRTPRRITRRHATIRLLQHGPLRFPEFVAITGWPRSVASSVLQRLKAEGEVCSDYVPACRDAGIVVYRLADYGQLTQGRRP